MLDAAGAVAQVDVEARGVAARERAVDAVGDHPLGALAPAAAAESGDGAAQLLARARERVRQLGLVAAEPQRRLPARQSGERDQGERGAVGLGERGQRGGDKRDGAASRRADRAARLRGEGERVP